MTKLFLRSTQTNGVGPTYFDMLATAGAGSTTATVTTTASGTEIQWTQSAGGAELLFISGRAPSGGFTLTTTDISLWLHEVASTANCGGAYRIFKRAADGTETELGGGLYSDGVELTKSTPTEMTWTGNPTDTAFAENDRILLKIKCANVGTMGASTAVLTYNGADTTTGGSFFQINETVTFKAEAGLPSTVLNTPADAGTVATLTPTLNFTGTDTHGHTIEYNVQVDTAATFDSQGSDPTVASWDVANRTAATAMYSGSTIKRCETFTNTSACTLASCVFNIYGSGSPTGNVTATLYAITGDLSTYPTGSALATSDAVDAATIPTSPNTTLVTFTFSGAQRYAMQAATNYAIVLEYTGGSSSNYIAVGHEQTGTYSGGQACNYISSWSHPATTTDLIFCVYNTNTSGPLVSAFSATDAGFTAGHPFATDVAKDYTLQTNLTNGLTYYWRAAAIDSVGQGAFPAYRSFTVSTTPPDLLYNRNPAFCPILAQ